MSCFLFVLQAPVTYCVFSIDHINASFIKNDASLIHAAGNVTYLIISYARPVARISCCARLSCSSARISSTREYPIARANIRQERANFWKHSAATFLPPCLLFLPPWTPDESAIHPLGARALPGMPQEKKRICCLLEHGKKVLCSHSCVSKLTSTLAQCQDLHGNLFCQELPCAERLKCSQIGQSLMFCVCAVSCV